MSLEETIAELKATLALRTQTLKDMNEALVAALDRAERAEAALEKWQAIARGDCRVPLGEVVAWQPGEGFVFVEPDAGEI